MEEIHVESSNGSGFGYVAEPGDVQITNFFHNRDILGSGPVIDALIRRDQPVAFLCNLEVEEEFRGNGQGASLMDEFMDEAALQDANLIFLVCDNSESQVDGFNLQAWYESLGFQVLMLEGQNSTFPLMVYDGQDDFLHLLED